MSEVKDFLKAISQNHKAMEMIRAAEEPADIEKAAVLYAEVAEKSGITVSKETIQSLLEGKERIQKENTEKAENTVKEALSDSDLDSVAGGVVYNNCESEATSTDWCWFSDACDLAWNWYGDEDIYTPTDMDGNPIKKVYKDESNDIGMDPNDPFSADCPFQALRFD